MKPIGDRSVYDWISDLGVDLVYTSDLPPQRLGAYLDDERRILCRPNLTHPLEQETLHHEYIHAVHRDRTMHPAVEWRAWREAAKLIVDPFAYAAAETMSHSSAWIARELGTTVKIIEAYRKAVTRGEILARAA